MDLGTPDASDASDAPDASPEGLALDAPKASSAPRRVITTLESAFAPAIVLGAAGAKPLDPGIRERIKALTDKARQVFKLRPSGMRAVPSRTQDAALLVAMGAHLSQKFGAKRRRRIRAIAAKISRPA